jgi:thiamine pyrophosphate-dependent acetolactate synthase large subunit-like protein
MRHFGFLAPLTDRTVPLSPETVFDVLNAVKPHEAVIVNQSDIQHAVVLAACWDQPRAQLLLSRRGALGFGSPAAWGYNSPSQAGQSSA